MKPIKLFDHQKPAYKYMMSHDKCVIAMAPGGGKTVIGVKGIAEIITENPLAKIIIHAHNTNVIKDNWITQLTKFGVPFSTSFAPNHQVHLCLPQNEKHIKGYYDLYIGDEVHQNYLAEQIQRTITKITRPDGILKEWLFTGTPSKFIKKGGYNIDFLAMCDIPEENFAKLNFELVATNYNWIGQYNNDLELKSSCIMTKEQNEQALKDVIDRLIKRLKFGWSPKDYNFPGIISTLKTWAKTFVKLKKTLIACKRIEQATDIYNILKLNGVNVTLSHNQNDGNSKEIHDFKDGKYNVLVVVNRAILGYDDVNLYNVIDMSGTQSPDKIYQMFARVIRGTQDMTKFYIKVTTNEVGMKDLIQVCMNAALMLTHKKALSTYNGDNFDGIMVPIIKESKNKIKKVGDKKLVNIKKNGKLIFPEFTNDVIKLVKLVVADFNNQSSIYGMVTVGEVRSRLTGSNHAHTYEEILLSIK